MTTDTNINAASTQDQSTASTPTQTGAANPGSTEAKFTQADVDRILKEKLEKAPEREARIKAELLKQLGLADDADFNVVKSTIADAQKRKESEMTEAQKATELAEKVIKERDAAIAERDKERAERRQDRIESELRSALTTAKANNPKTVLSYVLVNHRDAMQALLTDDGKIDDKAMTALIETVQKEDPTLFGGGKTTVQATVIHSNANGRVAQPTQKVDTSKFRI